MRQPIHEAKCIVLQRPQALAVVVRQELGLVCRHVHIDRALALARLTRQAQIQRLANAFVVPVGSQHLALHQFP